MQNSGQKSLLHIASEFDSKECVKVLLQHKAVVNVKDTNGCTPLYVAAGNGNYEIIKMIVAVPDCDVTNLKVCPYIQTRWITSGCGYTYIVQGLSLYTG